MKKSIYLFSSVYLLISLSVVAQQLKIGDKLDSTITLADLRSGKEYEIKSDFDKLILIDFWATWCAPCFENMPHLESLQEKFKEELVIFPVSMEDEERINKFISKKTYNLRFSNDKENKLSSIFPYRIVPHAVLIDFNGEVIAITEPKNITEDVIYRLLEGENVELPVKEDRIDFDLMKDDLFEVPMNTKESFIVLGKFDGLPSFQKKSNDGEYKDRRITFINQSIRGIYQYIFDRGWRRFQIDEHESELLEDDFYSVDLIIESPNESILKTTLMTKMKEQFNLQIDTLMVESEVILLYVEDENKLPKSSEKFFPYTASGDHFTSKGSSIADFASYLEGFGIVGGKLECDYCQEEFFEIDFNFEPENPDSFWESLKKIGLNLKKEKRSIEMIKLSQID